MPSIIIEIFLIDYRLGNSSGILKISDELPKKKLFMFISNGFKIYIFITSLIYLYFLIIHVNNFHSKKINFLGINYILKDIFHRASLGQMLLSYIVFLIASYIGFGG